MAGNLADFQALSSKYKVTQKVVLAQQDYIKDLERKNALLMATAQGHATQSPSSASKPLGKNAGTPSKSQVLQLQRGIEYFRGIADKREEENAKLRDELQLARGSILQGESEEDSGRSRGAGSPDRPSRRLLQLQRQMVAMQTKHAREMEDTKNDMQKLEDVVSRNQRLAASTQKALEQERRRRERLVEEEVAVRVRDIVQNTEHGSVVEVATLRSENARLKHVLEDHDNGASELRAQLVSDVERLRKQVEAQRKTHNGSTAKLREQLGQMGALMEEREIIIAEERQAFESELALEREVGKQKEQALRRQIEELNDHAEALTSTLSMQPLSEDPLVPGVEDEGLGEVKTVASVEKACAQRIRSVLKMKEQSEARLLSEREELLQQVQEADTLKSEHERLREKDWAARLEEKEKMIELWETREETLLEENQALKEKVDSVVKLATEKETALSEEITRLNQSLESHLQLGKGSLDDANDTGTEGRVTERVVLGVADKKANNEAKVLTSELSRLQQMFDAYKKRYHSDTAEEISRQNTLLDRVIALAEDQLLTIESGGSDESGQVSYRTHGSKWGVPSKQEVLALQKELSVLRRNALEREGSLSSVMAAAIKTETELRSEVADAVEKLEDAVARHMQQQREAQAQVSELREHMRSADETHSRAEELAASELKRLRLECDNLRTKVKVLRKKHEDQLNSTEDKMKAHAKSARYEAQQLRQVVVNLQKMFTSHRQSSERERARLTTEIEQLEAQKTEALEMYSQEQERVESERDEISERLKKVVEERDALAGEVENLRRELEDMRLGEIGLDSSENNEISGGRIDDRIDGDDVDLFSNAPGLSLPTLWRKRQRGILEANQRTTLEIELLRERLVDAESRLTDGRDPLLAEVRSLRQARDESLEAIKESQELWEDERKRFIEQVEVMEERVKVAEKSAETQVKHLVAETEAVKSIQERIKGDEAAWNIERQQAEEAIESRRSALEEEYERRRSRDEKHLENLEDHVLKLRKSLQDLPSLEDMVKISGADSIRKEYEILQKRCEVAESALKAERDAVARDQNHKAEMESLSMGELRQYRNKFHHLRRVATEQQATLAAEKRALLEQIEELTSQAGAKRHAAEITEKFRTQMQASESASAAREEALNMEVVALQSALSRERERAEKRIRANAEELKMQMDAYDQRIRVLQEQHSVESEGKNTSSSAVRKLEKRCLELERRSAQERAELERAMEKLRSDSTSREEELQRILARARSDHLAELRRLQLEQKSQDGLSPIKPGQKIHLQNVVDALREENNILSQQMERLRIQTREREKQTADTLKKLKAHVSTISAAALASQKIEQQQYAGQKSPRTLI